MKKTSILSKTSGEETCFLIPRFKAISFLLVQGRAQEIELLQEVASVANKNQHLLSPGKN